ncbi:hypothetical protein J6590_059959 [Homalodisca vitripennis]|nr:hypothetical protein J6590_059959 [Homalodisca vitripennis]
MSVITDTLTVSDFLSAMDPGICVPFTNPPDRDRSVADRRQIRSDQRCRRGVWQLCHQNQSRVRNIAVATSHFHPALCWDKAADVRR